MKKPRLDDYLNLDESEIISFIPAGFPFTVTYVRSQISQCWVTWDPVNGEYLDEDYFAKFTEKAFEDPARYGGRNVPQAYEKGLEMAKQLTKYVNEKINK
jgi:hypothetical protein